MSGISNVRGTDLIEFGYRNYHGHTERIAVYDHSNIKVINGNFIVNFKTNFYTFHIGEIVYVTLNGRDVSARELYERLQMRISYTNVDSMGRYMGNLGSQLYNQKQLENKPINNTTVEGTVKLKENKFSDLETIFFLNECRN